MSDTQEPLTAPYGVDIVSVVDDGFADWINERKNQRFRSVQEAYRMWLWDKGFDELGDNYTDAVAIVLVYLSTCVANPQYQGYFNSEDVDEPKAVLPIQVPEIMEMDQPTHWEFLTEENYHRMYREWRSRQPRH